VPEPFQPAGRDLPDPLAGDAEPRSHLAERPRRAVGPPGSPPGPGIETFLGAALGGTMLGLLVAAILVIGRG
jgi:hypothetical protein